MIYSERARIAISYANQEAARLGHDHIGTGHLLLGLIRQGDGTAIEILKDAEVDIEELRNELESMMEEGGRGTIIGKLQLGNRAKDALKFAEEESKDMSHKYLGTEHILLGIMREQEGIGGKVLTRFGVSLQSARAIAQAITAEEEPIETITFQNTDISVSNYDTGSIYVTEKNSSDVLNIEEASHLFRIKTTEMEDLLKSDSIPARKINGQWLFSRSALIKWLGDGNSKDY
jgi:ATP-dependent Clp protease ATP-binding subunit ClpA